MKTHTLNAVSNRATWHEELEFFDDETDAPLFEETDEDTHPDEITITLRDPSNGSESVLGTLTGGGLVISADGIVSFSFDLSDFDAKTYEVGVLYDQEDVVTQTILGHLPILEGL